MGGIRRVFMEIIRHPMRSLLLSLAVTVFAAFCVFGCFLTSLSDSFYRVFTGMSGYSLSVEAMGFTEFSDWDETIGCIMENEHIISYSNGIEASAECTPVDFVNVDYEGTTHGDDGWAGVYLYGNIDISQSSLFRNGELVLEEGTYPDQDSPGVAIDENLAKGNKTSVGDSVTVSFQDKEISLTVTGIYRAESTPKVEADSAEGYYTDAVESLLFCDYWSMAELKGTEEAQEMVFYIDDYQNMDECLVYVENVLDELGIEGFATDEIEDGAEEMAGIFQLLDRMDRIVVSFAYVLCGAIVIGMSMLWLRTYKGTFAICRILGESPMRYAGRVLAEAVLVTVPMASVTAGIACGCLQRNAGIIMQRMFEWCEISTAQQQFAYQSWDSGKFEWETEGILLRMGILELAVLLLAAVFALRYARMRWSKISQE